MRGTLARLALLALAGACGAAFAGTAAGAPANPWSPAEKYAEASVTNAFVHFVPISGGGYEERALNGWKWNSNGCIVQPGDLINRFLRRSDGGFDVITNNFVWSSDAAAGPRGDKCTQELLPAKPYKAEFILDSSYGRLLFTSAEARNFEIIWVDTRKPRISFAGGTVANGQATLRYAMTDDGEWAAVHVVARQGAKVITDGWLSLEDAKGAPKTAPVYVSDAKKGRLAVCLTPQDKAKNTGAPACRTLVVR